LGKKAAQRGTEAPRSQVQADIAAAVFGGRFSDLPIRTATATKR
jgi:hypothetical protein